MLRNIKTGLITEELKGNTCNKKSKYLIKKSVYTLFSAIYTFLKLSHYYLFTYFFYINPAPAKQKVFNYQKFRTYIWIFNPYEFYNKTKTKTTTTNQN